MGFKALLIPEAKLDDSILQIGYAVLECDFGILPYHRRVFVVIFVQ